MEHKNPEFEFLGMYGNWSNILMLAVTTLIVFLNRFYCDKKFEIETNWYAEFHGVDNGFRERNY